MHSGILVQKHARIVLPGWTIRVSLLLITWLLVLVTATVSSIWIMKPYVIHRSSCFAVCILWTTLNDWHRFKRNQCLWSTLLFSFSTSTASHSPLQTLVYIHTPTPPGQIGIRH
uniref:Uncharacterized protein n=1 Tax=Arundo donax TaxID=35708 RepID=A0A0A9FVI9_ARUDO